jgi:hypothetical protein
MGRGEMKNVYLECWGFGCGLEWSGVKVLGSMEFGMLRVIDCD